MRRTWPAVAACLVLSGCAVPISPSATATVSPATSAGGPAASGSTTTATASQTPPQTPTVTPSEWTPTASTTTAPTSATPSANPADSLEAAFAQPESGGIAAFLRKHPDYLPATVVIGDEIVSGSATGPVELTLHNVPAGTTRMYMTLACTDSRSYRMELTRADASKVGASWGDSCGYWGGLNGYTTTPFDATNPPRRFAITVAPDTRYSYVLYASPGR